MNRIYLSPPDVGDDERSALLAAFDSNWIAPVGPDLDAFEQETAAFAGVHGATAVASGTAALHLALLLAGVRPGDEVVVPTLTFVATANAVRYVGARPLLVDSEEKSWCVDPALVADLLDDRARRGALPAAMVTVDLYGQCADHDPVRAACTEYGVPLIEDAAEAVGATYRGRPAGSLGDLGAYSFNGNKILTTSGGGMLLTDDPATAARARFLATQARDDAAHYEHQELGYNYRLSNLLAAVGRAQLRTLSGRIARRREVHLRYREALADLPGIGFAPEADYGEPNHWLTVATVDPEAFGCDAHEVAARLEARGIEARPAWKPMHLQPLYREAEVVGGAVAAGVFRRGLCLPSGSTLSGADQARVVDAIGDVHRSVRP